MGVEISSVYKRFGSFTAVNGVSATIRDGEFFVMLGPSGCGKTTTLRMVAGLELPSEGEIHIDGRNVTHAEPRHRDIAMVFQDYGLYPHLTVEQNIEFPLKVRKVEKVLRRRKVRETADKLGIFEFLARRPGELSGGQRQRVSLARALVRNPKVFLMDEPLSNLDAKMRAAMRAEIKKLVQSLGITTIYVTHDQIEAMAMADRIAVMNRGDMVQVAAPLEIYERPRTHFVADFIGSPPMNLLVASISTDGRLICAIQGLADRLEPSEKSKAARVAAENAGRLFIGIRPEHIAISGTKDADAVPADVEFIEPLGQTINVYLAVGTTKLTVVTDKFCAKIGDRVWIRPDPHKIRAISPV